MKFSNTVLTATTRVSDSTLNLAAMLPETVFQVIASAAGLFEHYTDKQLVGARTVFRNCIRHGLSTNVAWKLAMLRNKYLLEVDEHPINFYIQQLIAGRQTVTTNWCGDRSHPRLEVYIPHHLLGSVDPELHTQAHIIGV